MLPLRGLPLSVALHAGVATAVLVWGMFNEKVEDPEPADKANTIPFEIVEIGLETNIAPIIPREVEEPEPEEPEPEVPPVPEPVEEEDIPLEEQDEEVPDEEAIEDDTETEAEEDIPDSAASPEETDPDEAEPDASEEDVPPEETEEPTEEEADEPPPPPPEATDPPEPEEEIDPLAALLADSEKNLTDVRDESRRVPPPRQERQQLENTAPPPDERVRGVGDRTARTATVQDLIVSQLKQRGCWQDVSDMPNPERLVVTVRVEMNRDGSIKGKPDLIDPSRPPIGDRYMSIAIERALAAPEKCDPLDLPEDDYDIWRQITYTIGPE